MQAVPALSEPLIPDHDIDPRELCLARVYLLNSEICEALLNYALPTDEGIDQPRQQQEIEHDPPGKAQECGFARLLRVEPIEIGVQIGKGAVDLGRVEHPGEFGMGHPVLRAEDDRRSPARPAGQAAPGAAQLPLERGTAQTHAIREGLLQSRCFVMKLFCINHL